MKLAAPVRHGRAPARLACPLGSSTAAGSSVRPNQGSRRARTRSIGSHSRARSATPYQQLGSKMVASRPILEVTGSGVISSRVARDSTLIERQPAVRLPVGASLRSRLPTRATPYSLQFFVRLHDGGVLAPFQGFVDFCAQRSLENVPTPRGAVGTRPIHGCQTRTVKGAGGMKAPVASWELGDRGWVWVARSSKLERMCRSGFDDGAIVRFP